MPTIKANNVDLYYEEHGVADAPVILLVMGLGTQMIAWPDALVQGLVKAGYRVILYDNRDVGLSQRMEGARAPGIVWAMIASRFRLPLRIDYTLTDMAADGIALLDALDVKAAHIVGASMGGMIVQIMAAKYPGRVLSLTSVMSSSGARGLPGPSAEIRKKMIAKRPSNPTREEAIALGVDTIKQISYPDPSREPDAFEQMAGRAFDRGYYPIGMKRQLLAIVADGSRAKLLRKITAPTLIIHGAADPLVPMACSEDIARHIPGSKLEIIAEMAHDLPPSQVTKMVDLIAGHTGSAA